MKITIKQIFLLSIFISISVPWIIGIGGSQGIYLYEILVLLSYFLIIINKSYSRSKLNLIKVKDFKNFEGAGKFFILFLLIGIFYNLYLNILSEEFDLLLLLKMNGHALITIFILLGSFVAGFTLFNGKKDIIL